MEEVLNSAESIKSEKQRSTSLLELQVTNERRTKEEEGFVIL